MDVERLEGQVLDGRIRLTRFVGTGESCALYEAQHLLLNRNVAVKFVFDDAANGKGHNDKTVRGSGMFEGWRYVVLELKDVLQTLSQLGPAFGITALSEQYQKELRFNTRKQRGSLSLKIASVLGVLVCIYIAANDPPLLFSKMRVLVDKVAAVSDDERIDAYRKLAELQSDRHRYAEAIDTLMQAKQLCDLPQHIYELAMVDHALQIAYHLRAQEQPSSPEAPAWKAFSEDLKSKSAIDLGKAIICAGAKKNYQLVYTEQLELFKWIAEGWEPSSGLPALIYQWIQYYPQSERVAYYKKTADFCAGLKGLPPYVVPEMHASIGAEQFFAHDFKSSINTLKAALEECGSLGAYNSIRSLIQFELARSELAYATVDPKILPEANQNLRLAADRVINSGQPIFMDLMLPLSQGLFAQQEYRRSAKVAELLCNLIDSPNTDTTPYQTYQATELKALQLSALGQKAFSEAFGGQQAQAAEDFDRAEKLADTVLASADSDHSGGEALASARKQAILKSRACLWMTEAVCLIGRYDNESKMRFSKAETECKLVGEDNSLLIGYNARSLVKSTRGDIAGAAADAELALKYSEVVYGKNGELSRTMAERLCHLYLKLGRTEHLRQLQTAYGLTQ